jgi:AcrR family transcriptional regulator
VAVNAPRERGASALSRRVILDVAIDELDTHGLPGFSMRRLAESVGVSAPSLYWHFRSRDELFDALVDHAFAAISTDAELPGWQDEVLRLVGQAWSVGRTHPGLLPLLSTAPAYPSSAQRLVRSVLLALRRGGFGPDEAVAHTRALIWTTFGFMRAADRGVLGRPAADHVSTRAAVRTPIYVDLDDLPPADLAMLAECLPALSQIDVDELFDRTIRLLLSSMAPSAAQRRVRPRGRSG